MEAMDKLRVDADERDDSGSCFVDAEQRAPFDVDVVRCFRFHVAHSFPASKDFVLFYFGPSQIN